MSKIIIRTVNQKQKWQHDDERTVGLYRDREYIEEAGAFRPEKAEGWLTIKASEAKKGAVFADLTTEAGRKKYMHLLANFSKMRVEKEKNGETRKFTIFLPKDIPLVGTDKVIADVMNEVPAEPT